MTKKSLKAEDIIELVQNGDRIIDAIFSRLEKRLTILMENIIEKWAVTVNQKMEKMLEVRVKKISEDLAAATTENKQLRRRVEDLETYSRLDNVVINGLPSDSSLFGSQDVSNQNDDANLQCLSEPTKFSLFLFNNYMNLDIRQEDIAKIHYISSKAGVRSVLVKFANRRHRDRVLQARSKLKNLPNQLRIYVNEHLTSSTAAVFANARDRVRKKQLFSTWVRDGKVFFKTTGDASEKPKSAAVLADLMEI